MLGWGILIGGGIVWEAIALRRKSHPTLSAIIRKLPRRLLVITYGWLGWHFLRKSAEEAAK